MNLVLFGLDASQACPLGALNKYHGKAKLLRVLIFLKDKSHTSATECHY